MGLLVPIIALAMAPDAAWAVGVTQDGTIRTFGTGAEPRALPHAVPVDGRQPVAVSWSGERLIRVAWAAEDGLGLYENDDADGPRIETFPASAPVRALAFSPSGRIVVAACADGTLLGLDTATREFGRRLALGLPPAGALALAADDGPVVASLRDSSVRRFDLATGVAYVVDTGLEVRHLAITPDGDAVLALGADGILRRWQVSLGTPPDLLDLDAASTALAVDRRGDRVLIGGPDGRLWLHDLAGGPAVEFGAPERDVRPVGRGPVPSDAGLVPSDAGPAGQEPSAPARPESAAIIDEDVSFTVYRPRFLSPEKWADLLVFAHKTDPVVDPDLGPIDPNEVVEARARAHFGGNVPPRARVDSTSGLSRGAHLRIVPDLPGIQCNPAEAELDWWEPVHEVSFRLRADASLVGSTVRGAVRIWFGPILIGEVSLAINVRAGGAADDQSITDRAPMYNKIFPSYSHLDLPIVAIFEDFARALGVGFTRDVIALRAGELWQPRLLELIQEADVFLLFWSSNSMRSPYCQQEWEHALTLRRPAFIKPLFWEDPLPEDMTLGLPPAALREIHFVKVQSGPPGQASERPGSAWSGPVADPAAAYLPPPPPLGEAVTQQVVAGPILVVQAEGTSYVLHTGSSYRVGRDPQSNIVIANPRVSWAHAVLRVEQGGWLVEDLGSTNGTFVGSQRISRYPITADSTLRLASPADGPVIVCSLPGAARSSPPVAEPAAETWLDDDSRTAAGPAVQEQHAPGPQPSSASAGPPPGHAGPPPGHAGPPPGHAGPPPVDAGPPPVYAAAPRSGSGQYPAWPASPPASPAARRPALRRPLLVIAAVVALAAIIAVIIIVLH